MKSSSRKRLIPGLVIVVMSLSLAACTTGPIPGLPSSSIASSPAPTTPAPTPGETTAPEESPSPEESASPEQTPAPTPDAGVGDIVLPSSCEGVYSPAMLARLNAENPPLNHADVTMLSTGIEGVFDVLDSGVPTLRCSWGMPSEWGLATNVSILDAEQSARVRELVEAHGLGCEDFQGGTLCRIVTEHPGSDLSDASVSGESHFFRGNGWVSTLWLNYGPEGYTEDVVATLWG